MKPFVSLIAIAALTCAPLSAQNTDPIANVEAEAERTVRVAQQLWDWAELGYLEERTSALMVEELVAEGFAVEGGIAEIPTAFVAEWGEGGPVIAILAEMDALPGINQSAEPTRDPIEGKGAGHACGHNLFGAGSLDTGTE